MRENAVISHSPEVAWVMSDDRVVIVRLDDLAEPPLVLSGSASAIWAAVEPPASLEELVQRVAFTYDIPQDDVREEIEGCVTNCIELGILVVRPEATIG